MAEASQYSSPDEFVESVPFGATQGYVRQVFGNYWNYLRLYNPQVSQLAARYSEVHLQMPTDVATLIGS